MQEQITALILQPHTAFFGLFLFLFLYTLRDSKDREGQLRDALKESNDINLKSLDTIKQLTDKLGVVDEIKDDVKELKMLKKTGIF